MIEVFGALGFVLAVVSSDTGAGVTPVSGGADTDGTGSLNRASSSSPSIVSRAMSLSVICVNFALFSVRIRFATS